MSVIPRLTRERQHRTTCIQTVGKYKFSRHRRGRSSAKTASLGGVQLANVVAVDPNHSVSFRLLPNCRGHPSPGLSATRCCPETSKVCPRKRFRHPSIFYATGPHVRWSLTWLTLDENAPRTTSRPIANRNRGEDNDSSYTSFRRIIVGDRLFWPFLT